jgi:dihydropteroate synthase
VSETLLLRGRSLELDSSRPLVVGIVNATPDSFSDGGRYRGLDAQLARARELIEDGAEAIDVGGESGVTGRPAVEPAEEVARAVPLVERLAADGVTVSIDTWRAEVAHAALEAGAAMVNDMSGLRDPALAELAGETGAALVVTHTRVPPKIKGFPLYDDVVSEVVSFLRGRMALALERGVRAEQILLDPGVDLAKTPAESVRVLRELGRVGELGRPVLLAVSRKDFVGALTGRPPRERLAGTLAAIDAGLDAGAAILRVHDVRSVCDYLRVRRALHGVDDVPEHLRLDRGLRREQPVA